MNRLIVWTLGVALLAGCSREEPSPPSSSSASPSAVKAPPPPPAAAAGASSASTVKTPLPPASGVASSQTTAPAPKTVQKKAAVGSGEKGRGYGMGPIATPVGSFFAMRERLAYDIQIPEAMKLFQAFEGRLPKSHEEFMQKIIKENHITLPLLPEGCRYLYDPKRGELMVERPAPR